MKFIEVTDDQGVTQWVNPFYILSFKPRVKSELGSIIRFSNGTSMSVIDSVQDIKASLLPTMWMRKETGELCRVSE